MIWNGYKIMVFKTLTIYFGYKQLISELLLKVQSLDGMNHGTLRYTKKWWTKYKHAVCLGYDIFMAWFLTAYITKSDNID